jgi:hypothetical protein
MTHHWRRTSFKQLDGLTNLLAVESRVAPAQRLQRALYAFGRTRSSRLKSTEPENLYRAMTRRPDLQQRPLRNGAQAKS